MQRVYLDAQFQATGNDYDLAGLSVDDPELGSESDVAVLKDEEHLGVAVVEIGVHH